MLTPTRIKNFKAWRDTGEIRLAPLTVLFGANSAGKSSLGHLLLAMKQTAASADRRRALHTGDEGSLIDLGTFVETLPPTTRKRFSSSALSGARRSKFKTRWTRVRRTRVTACL